MKTLLTLILCSLAGGHLRGEPKTSVPEFARICGVRVGYDTITTLERKLGRGLASRGGHPRGARSWEAPKAGCDIYADGFYYSDRKGSDGGAVLDVIFLSAHTPGRSPKARLAGEDARFMGVVSLGMTKREVRAALKNKLPPPKVRWNRLIWEASGYVRLRGSETAEAWRGELGFKRGSLASIEIRGS